MLRSALIAALLCASTAAAREGIRRPQRLTFGPGDHYLGLLSPTGETLFFVSDRNATSQIFAAPGRGGAATLLFDEAADVTWPRLDGSGQRLLYIAYQRDAGGDLCLRDLRAPHKVGPRRCLGDPGSAALQALFLGDGDLALVGRAGLHGDLALRRLDQRGGTKATLVPRNLSTPTLSPDGRFVAYVPLERASAVVGPSFAARATGTIELQPLGDPPAAPQPLRFGLPGTSAFPAFSLDGRYLYFSQFLNDTNFDGVVDGNDHGVLFRVPFDPHRPAAPVEPLRLEQLTSAGWNCQYPAPAGDRLIVTCASDGGLNVYALPLDGAVPAAWSEEQLRDELQATDNRWEKLLLLGRLAARLGEREGSALLEAQIRLHLELGEYASARYFTDQLARRGGPAAPLAIPLGELIDHRRAERSLGRGQPTDRFVTEAQERRGRLERLGGDGDQGALAWLALGEVADALGDLPAATAALRRIRLPSLSSPLGLHLFAERALALLREQGEREELLGLLGQLAEHPALEESAQIDYAAAFVAEVTRGRAPAARRAEAQRRRQLAPQGGHLALLLAVEESLAELKPETQDRAREEVFKLYRANKLFARRRALVTATLARAAAADHENLAYQFANTWVSYVPRDRAARRQAELLFREVVLDRAYAALGRGEVGDARGHFYGVTLQTDALEAHHGFFVARLAEGKSAAEVVAEYRERFATTPDHPALHYVIALAAAQAQGGAPEERQEALTREALAALDRAAPTQPLVEVEHLRGALLHRRFLRLGDPLDAAVADSHYLLALDLAPRRPRYRAATLEQLGQLQAGVGNHRLALGALEERERLPFPTPLGELAHRLAVARSRFHVDDHPGAAAAVAAALALVERHGELAGFLALTLDRAALYHLASGDHRRASQLYERLLQRPPSERRDSPRQRLVLHLGRAAAAVGAEEPRSALAALAEAEPLIDLAEPPPSPAGATGPRPSPDEIRAQQRLVLLGLRAHAHRALGDLPAAATAMAARRHLLDQRLRRRAVDDDLLDLALAEAHLADYARRRGDQRGAVAHLEAALGHSDRFAERTGTAIHPLALQLLEELVAAHLDRRVPLSGFTVDLPRRVEEGYGHLCRLGEERWSAVRDRLGLALTLLRLDRR